MINRKNIFRFLAIGLCGAVLAGCSTNGNSTADTSAPESSEMQSKDTTSNESSSVTSETTSSSESEEESDKDPIALENLELPEIYENTIIYNGTINPELTATIYFPEPYTGDNLLSLETNENGSFSTSLSQEDFKEGDEITFYVGGGGMPEEEVFYRTVLPAEEGKEFIKSSMNTSEAEQALIEKTTLPDIYPNTRRVRGETAEETTIYYSIEEEPINKENSTTTYGGELAGYFSSYFNNIELQVGQTAHFYIVSDGVVATIDKEVMDMTSEQEQAITEIQEKTDLPDFYENTNDYYGKTVPNAKVVLSNPEQLSLELTAQSDDNGDFSAPYLSLSTQESYTIEEGDPLLFTITDEKGYTESIETKVLPKSDDPDYKNPVASPK